uniref:Putative lpxtg-motif cell wall anchor domain protein n=1 Tax=Ixodes ricinus TaxID=34613 RepID=V5H2T4_IXORI
MRFVVPVIFCFCAQVFIASAAPNSDDAARQLLRLGNERNVPQESVPQQDERFSYSTSGSMKHEPAHEGSQRIRREKRTPRRVLSCPDDQYYDASLGKCMTYDNQVTTEDSQPPSSNTPSTTTTEISEQASSSETQPSDPTTVIVPSSSTSLATIETTKESPTTTESRSATTEDTVHSEATSSSLPSSTGKEASRPFSTSEKPAIESTTISPAPSKAVDPVDQSDKATSPTKAVSNDPEDIHQMTTTPAEHDGTSIKPDPEGLIKDQRGVSPVVVFFGALLCSTVLTTLIAGTSYVLRSRAKHR